MHSFQVVNDNGFQFYGYPVGRHHTNGNIRVVMCLLYPPTCYIMEKHLSVTPSMDLDVQLVTNLMLIMEKSCLEHLFQHHCYIPQVRFSLKERLLYTLNKLYVTQVKSYQLLLLE